MPPTAQLVSARPILRVDGRDYLALSETLLALEVFEDIAGLYRCEARFTNWGQQSGGPGFLFFSRQTLDFGKTLVVAWSDQTLFSARITALEVRFLEGATPEFVVFAEDAFQDFRQTRRTRVFNDQSDADVFQRLAQDHGLQADVSISGPTHRVLAQVNQSDLAFLRDRARALGAELWIADGRLHAATRPQRREGATSDLTYGSNLRTFTALADLAHQRTKFVVSGWDVSGKKPIKAEATDSALSSETGGGDSGSSVLQQAFGERIETLAHTVPVTADEAQSAAEAAARWAGRRFVTGHGECDPSVGLRVGGRVCLSQVGPLFTGEHYITEVHHTFDTAKGLRTFFRTECAVLRPAN
jgi:phage protein D